VSTFAYRFVGLEKLPSRLTGFDLSYFFQLGSADINVLTERFRAEHRPFAAVMLLVLRATGRPLDVSSPLARALLRDVGVW
jgi:hypothetical protein